MLWSLAAWVLAVGNVTPVRPATGAAVLWVARIGPTPREVSLPSDGWERRALVDRDTHAVRVLGPSRPAPDAAPGAVAIDQAAALRTVAEMGWPGADAATLVRTAQGVPAWRIDPPASLRGLSNPVFLVDARTGRAWLRHDRARTEAVGAFSTNPVVTPDASSFPLIDYDPAAADGDLAGARVAVFNCVAPTDDAVCGYATITPSNADGDFLHPAPNIDVPADNVQLEDAFAVQSVHHHAEVFLAYLDTLGVPPMACLAQDTPLVLIANYKAHLGGDPILISNASYLGDCGLVAAFGQGTEADYGYDGDVIYHELTHGVVEALMGGGLLGLRTLRPEAVLRDAAAMNEGTADFIAGVYTDNSTQAEYVALRTGEPARELDNTLRCPASLSGEAHADGELWGGALWASYATLGSPFVLAVFDAIALLPEDATFEEGAATLVAVVDEELGAAAADTVTSVMDARGLLDCPRVVDWDAMERPLWLRPRGQDGKFRPMQPAPAQIAVPLPADAVGFVLRFATEIRVTPGFTPDTEIHALVSYGTPIAFSYDDDDDGFTNVLAEPDLYLPAIDGLATGDGVTVAAPGGQTVYVSLFNQSANVTLIADVQVDIEFADGGTAGGTDDAGAADTGTSAGAPTDDSGGSGSGSAANEGSGCACRSTPTSPRAWPLAWLLLTLASRRRRRGVGYPGWATTTRAMRSGCSPIS